MSEFLQAIPNWVKIAGGILISLGIPILIVIDGIISYLKSGPRERVVFFCVMLSILLTIGLSALYFSTHSIEESTVYTTATGECYHSSGCSTLHSRYKTTIREAEKAGYRSCSVCNPHTRETFAPVFWIALISGIIGLCIYSFFDRYIAKRDALKARQMIFDKYNGKPISEVFSIPPGFTIGADGAPEHLYWPPDHFIVCTNRPGGAYHKTNCRYAIPKLARTMWEAQFYGCYPCKVCQPAFYDFSWYLTYLDAKRNIELKGFELTIENGIIHLKQPLKR